MIHDSTWNDRFDHYRQSTFDLLNDFSTDRDKWDPHDIYPIMKDKNGLFFVFLSEFFDSCLIDAEVSWDEEKSGGSDSFYRANARRKKDKEINRDRFHLILTKTLLTSMLHYNKDFADAANRLIDSNKSIPLFLYYFFFGRSPALI